ncbi:hypothetical protein HDU76_007669, partial [Blyttiomyces sp. JEL0837]
MRLPILAHPSSTAMLRSALRSQNPAVNAPLRNANALILIPMRLNSGSIRPLESQSRIMINRPHSKSIASTSTS